MSDLKLAALSAYRGQQLATEESNQEWQRRMEQLARECFAGIFGIEPDSACSTEDGNNAIVSASGIALIYDSDGSGFNLWDKCPHCGVLVVGQRVHSLESLGRALADGFVPHHSHNCPGVDTPEEADKKLDGHALIAIASELRRMNDRNDRQDAQLLVSFRDPTPAEIDYAISLVPRAEEYLNRQEASADHDPDPFTPPDEVWRWLPEAVCVAVDENGKMFWYSDDAELDKVIWRSYGDARYMRCCDLGAVDWRTTKRMRPAHL